MGSLLKVMLFGLSYFIIDPFNGHCLSFASCVFATRVVLDDFLTESTDSCGLIRFCDKFVFLGLQLSLNVLIFPGVFYLS